MRFSHYSYKWSKLFTTIRHEWSLVGPQAALSFWASITPGYPHSAGLETHYFQAPAYMHDDAPSHLDCPFTGGRCWHDGTSLYAIETLWPMIEPMLQTGDHETIFRVLEREYNSRFGTAKASQEDL